MILRVTIASLLVLTPAIAAAHPMHLNVSDAAAAVVASVLSAATVSTVLWRRRSRDAAVAPSRDGGA